MEAIFIFIIFFSALVSWFILIMKCDAYDDPRDACQHYEDIIKQLQNKIKKLEEETKK